MSARTVAFAAAMLLSACASWNGAPQKLAIAPTQEIREQAAANAAPQGEDEANVAADLKAARTHCYDTYSRTWKPTRECDALRIGSSG
jgi:hypothetical protein